MQTRAVIASVLAAASMTAAGEPADAPAGVTVYLPRQVDVAPGPVRLGDVCIVRCRDAELAKKVEAVALGRSPWPGETLVIDRQTIRSRLASSRVRPADVTFTGADAVAMTGRHKIISPEEIQRCAESYLKGHPPAPEGCQWRPLHPPKEIVLPMARKVELEARPAKAPAAHHVKVAVSAMQDGRPVAEAEVTFRLIYRISQAVATRAIAAGQVITPDLARVETVMSEVPPAGEWTSPYGKVASGAISPGTVIRPHLVKPATAAVLVRRNETVVMEVRGPGFVVTGMGVALQEGRCGEVIKVRNADSNRVVAAKVAPDGTVRPVFEEKEG